MAMESAGVGMETSTGALELSVFGLDASVHSCAHCVRSFCPLCGAFEHPL